METSIAVAIFSITYILIIFEKVHKTTAALAGGTAMILFKVLDTEQAFESVELEVIFLLTGMMIIANALASTGVFQWIAIRAAKLAKGSPIRVLVILCAITALASAFLDNVTTVVLLAPVTLVVAQTLEVRAVPMLIAEALASNIGGTATLIGDPPNILIASHANISFVEFFVNVGPVSILSLIAFLAVSPWLMGRGLDTPQHLRERVMEIDDSELITDTRLLKIALAILGVVIAGFLLQGVLGYEPAGVALIGGAALLLITGHDPHEALREVEWATLFFFIGLFIVVGGLEHEGVLETVGNRAAELTGDSVSAATYMILWMSALASGVVDNIPYTATMLPIVEEMGHANPNIDGDAPHVLWWALAIGADMGGNLTIVGASANVLVANISARSGRPITFFEFFRYGAVTTVGTMVIASIYLWIRFFVFG
ncbi:MAG: ArsB/NhaD family transporter [Dehalococcoidia bacterium]